MRLSWNQCSARSSHGVVTPHMSHRTTWRMSLVTVISVPDVGENRQGGEEDGDHDSEDGGEAHGWPPKSFSVSLGHSRTSRFHAVNRSPRKAFAATFRAIPSI